jgi:hypothetical protein
MKLDLTSEARVKSVAGADAEAQWSLHVNSGAGPRISTRKTINDVLNIVLQIRIPGARHVGGEIDAVTLVVVVPGTHGLGLRFGLRFGFRFGLILDCGLGFDLIGLSGNCEEQERDECRGSRENDDA